MSRKLPPAEAAEATEDLFVDIKHKPTSANLIALRAANVLDIPEQFYQNAKKQKCRADIKRQIITLDSDEIFIKEGILQNIAGREITDEKTLRDFADKLFVVLNAAIFIAIAQDRSSNNKFFDNTALVLSKINPTDKKSILDKLSPFSGKGLSYVAVECCEYNLLKILLENGANPHVVDNDKDTLLHVLARTTKEQDQDNPEVLLTAILLLQSGVNREAVNIDETLACEYIAPGKILNKIMESSTEEELKNWKKNLEKDLSRKPEISIGKDVVVKTYSDDDVRTSTQSKLNPIPLVQTKRRFATTEAKLNPFSESKPKPEPRQIKQPASPLYTPSKLSKSFGIEN